MWMHEDMNLVASTVVHVLPVIDSATAVATSEGLNSKKSIPAITLKKQ